MYQNPTVLCYNLQYTPTTSYNVVVEYSVDVCKQDHMKGRMTMRFLLFVFSFFLSSPSFAEAASCSPTTCIEGICIDDECQCLDGYDGDDCSIPYTKCEDGDRVCFNGSECVRNNERDTITMKYKYHCDCSKAFGISSFAGESCQYDVTATCQASNTVTTTMTAFCTNGGTCVQVVNDIARGHQGCDCVDGYEGLHCQYLVGSAPAEELAAVATLRAARDRSNDLTPVALFFIIVIPIAVVAMFVYFEYRRRTSGKEEESKEVETGSELGIRTPKAADGKMSNEDEARPEII